MAMAQLQRFMRRDEDYDVPAIDDTAELPVIAPEDDDTTTLRPVVVADHRMSYGRQSAEALRHMWQASRRRAREEHEREGSWLHRFKTRPRSIQDACDYAQSRAWVPPGHDGGISEKSGVLYFALLGRPLVTLGAALMEIGERPVRFSVVMLLSFATAMSVLTLFGHGRLAAEITGGVLLAVGVLCAVLMPRRSDVGEPEGDPGEEEDPS